MYKYMGMGLLGLFIVMIFPSGLVNVQDESKFYGEGTIVLRDAAGQIMLENSVHNRIVDTGEDFMNAQTFRSGSAAVDGDSIGTICLYVAGGGSASFDEVSEIDAEGTDAGEFDAGNAAGNTECQVSINAVTTGSTAVLAPADFIGGTHNTAGQLVAAIAVCQSVNTDSAGFDYANCADEGVLFAIFDITDVTLASSETVSITYTFDLSSSGT